MPPEQGESISFVRPHDRSISVAGTNRFFARSTRQLFEKAARSSPTEPCVFISHTFEDMALARKIGNQLKDLEIDIWLDAEDLETQKAAELGDEVKLAEAIEWGLLNCTHLLALISPVTRQSWWVPYEIGASRGRSKHLVFLVHKNVRDIPSYLSFGKQILDQYDLFKWATELSSKPYLTESVANVKKSLSSNPLDEVLPKFHHA